MPREARVRFSAGHESAKIPGQILFSVLYPFKGRPNYMRPPSVIVLLLGACLFAPALVEGKTVPQHQKRAAARSGKGDSNGAFSDGQQAIRLSLQEAKEPLDNAIANYTRVIERNPKSATAYHNRGNARLAKGDLDGAIADFNRAIDLRPKYADAYKNRATAKRAKGDLDGALADSDRGIELDPKSADAYLVRGVVKSDEDDLDGAISDYSEAIKLDPKFAIAYYNRATAKRMKGDFDGAISDQNRAIEVDPIFTRAYASRGHTQFISHRWKEALADYDRAFALSVRDQDYPHLYAWLSRACLGETNLANADLAEYCAKRRNAVHDDWVSTVAEYLLGTISEADLLAAANSPDAKKEKSQFCEAWFFAGMKQLLSADKTDAEEYFKKCLATEEKTFIEYQFAQSELGML
jgi:tetratricopeptide (TPR) repeat protein